MTTDCERGLAYIREHYKGETKTSSPAWLREDLVAEMVGELLAREWRWWDAVDADRSCAELLTEQRADGETTYAETLARIIAERDELEERLDSAGEWMMVEDA